MGTVTIQLDGLDPTGRIRAQVQAILATLQPGETDLHGLKAGILEIAGRHGLQALYDAFLVKSSGGTDEWGISWEPLGRIRTGEKLAMGLDPAQTVLIESGELGASLCPDAPYPGQVFDVQAEEGFVEVGTAVPYAAQHQNGYVSEKYGPVPARPLVPPDGALHQIAEDAMDAEIHEYLSRRLGEIIQMEVHG